MTQPSSKSIEVTLNADPDHESVLTPAALKFVAALQYLASWLRGTGAVAIFSLMEDAATAEICCSQIWQWRHSKTVLNNGMRVTATPVGKILDEETARPGQQDYADARALFEELALADDFPEFLTLPAYARMP